MSYQVLARKWRPRTFQEMVGQEPILRMLMNALDHQRLHHAYLFTGTRGVGKTTLARLFAKCLNCEAGISSQPCGTCGICVAIDEGKFLDLLEIDAASRTKVEDTRELLDNVQYAPTQGRFKVYLIDEVHMLSGHSFNALLKTLEEPPSHVKFLLATTDPKRLPITILSRCLQFNLKRVPTEKIAQQLATVCLAENIQFEAEALPLLAQAADGSMRDALSLLDQTIAFCSDHITTKDTQAMLGNIEHQAIFKLLDAISKQDGNRLLAEIATLSEQAPDFSRVLEELLSILHQISVVQIIKDSNTESEIIKLAELFTAEDVQLYYQIALIGRRDLAITPNQQQGFEMVMLRMLAFNPVPLGGTKQAHQATPNTTAKSTASNVAKVSDIKAANVNQSSELNQSPVPNTDHAKDPTPSTSTDWLTILSHLNLTGLSQVLASNCTLSNITDAQITLILSANHQTMLNKKLSERIEQALSTYFNKTMRLEIKIATTEIHTPAKQQQQAQAVRHANATDAISNDAQVKKMMDMFGATLDLGSIKAVE